MTEKESEIEDQHGHFYVLKLISQFFKEGCKSRKPFYINVEKQNSTGAFDNIIFKYEDKNGNFSHRLLQAHHERKPENPVSSKAFSDRYGDFSLIKYFLSYCSIKQDHFFGNIKDFILFSNANFDITEIMSKSAILHFTKVLPPDSNIEDSYMLDLTNIVSRYFRNNIGIEALANALIGEIPDPQETILRNYILKTYGMALMQEVIEISGQQENVTEDNPTMFDFKENFLTGKHLSDPAAMLRKTMRKRWLKNLKSRFIGNSNNSALPPETLNDKNLDILVNSIDEWIRGDTNLQLFQNNFPLPFIDQLIKFDEAELQNEFVMGHENLSNLAQRRLFTNNEFFPKHLWLPGNLGILFRSNEKLEEQEIKNLIEMFVENNFGNDFSKHVPSLQKLNGHVLVCDTSGHVKFRTTFFDDQQFEREDLNQFKQILLKKCDIQNLKDVSFKIVGLKTCYERQWLKLPTEQEIADIVELFCKDFVLVFQQPDYEETDKILRQEYANIFNLEYSVIIDDHINSEIIKWIMDVNSKELSHEDYDKFKIFINSEISKLQIANRSEQYCKTFMNLNIDYEDCATEKDVKTFLSQNSKNILMVFTESSVLTSIKLRNSIKNATVQHDENTEKQIYGMKDSVIFLPYEMIDDDILKAYELPNSNNLLVIVMDKTNLQNVFETFSKIQDILNDCKAKRIIVVVEINNKMFIRNTETLVCDNLRISNENDSYLRLDDDDLYNDLKDKQTKVNKKIVFHGKNFFLNQIIENEKFYESINGQILLKLLTEDNFDIGKASHVNDPTEINITRHIRLLKMNDDFFDQLALFKPQCFCIEGNTKEEVYAFLKEKNVAADRIIDAQVLIDKNDKVDVVDLFENVSRNSKFIVLDNKTRKQFFNFCRRYNFFQFRWLKLDDEQSDPQALTSKCSKTNLPICIKPFKLQNSKTLMDDKNFATFFQESQTGIICDDAGAGKSTTLSTLSQNLDQFFWHMRIDLNQHAKILSAKIEKKQGEPPDIIFKFGDNVTNYDKIILETLLNRQFTIHTEYDFKRFLDISVEYGNIFSLEQYIFLYCFFHGKLLIMLDGFDEISPSYSDLILQFVKILTKETKNKVWITSRPNLKPTLEREFQSVAYSLESFTEEEQRKYLIEFWKSQIDDSAVKVLSGRIEEHASWVMDHFKQLLPQSYSEFRGIPLKMKMISEIFMESIEMNNNEKMEIFEKIPNLYTLYHTFVAKKIEKFLKQTADLTKPYGPELYKLFWDHQNKCHEILGFLQIACDYKMESKDMISTGEQTIVNEWIPKFKLGIEKVGIVEKITNDDLPIFYHFTYAEYFCAQFLVKKLKHSPQLVHPIFVIVNQIFERNVPVFIFCFKYLLQHVDQLTTLLGGMSPIVYATQYGLINCMKEFLKDENFHHNFPDPDQLGKTLLHYAVEAEQINGVVFILMPAWSFIVQSETRNSEIYEAKLLKFIDTKDSKNKTAIEYVPESNENLHNLINEIRMACLDFLKFKKIPDMPNRRKYLREIYDFNYCYVQSLLRFAHFTTIQIVFDAFTQKDLMDFLFSREVNFFDDLCDSFPNKKTTLICHYFIQKFAKENFEVIERLLLALLQNNCMHLISALNLDIETIKFSEKFLVVFLTLASSCHEISAIEFISEKLDSKYSLPVLSQAINKGTKIEMLDCYFKFFPDIFKQDSEGQTLLPVAVSKKCSLKVIEYLLSKGFDPNIKDNSGKTAWEYAIKTENDNLINYFIANCSIDEPSPPSIKDFYSSTFAPDTFVNEITDGKSRLLHAIINNSISQVQFLLWKGADVNDVADENDNTPLHYACQNGLYEIAEILLEYGANFENENNDQKTPFNLCPLNSKVKELLANVVLIFEEIAKPEINLLKCVKMGWNNAENRQNQTLWHVAAKCREQDEAYLAEEICWRFNCNVTKTINQKDINGYTALHFAVKSGNLYTALYLLQHGAYYNATENTRNNTPLDLAKKGKNDEITSVLSKLNECFYAVKNKLINKGLNDFDSFENLFDALTSIIGKLSSIINLAHVPRTVNFKDRKNCSLLHYAFKNNNLQMIQLLLCYNTKLFKKDLEVASEKKCKELSQQIKMVFECIENEEIDQLKNFFASSNAYTALLINAQNYEGESAFRYAVKSNDPNFVIELLKKGAIVDRDQKCDNKKIQRLLNFIIKIFKCIAKGSFDSNSLIQQINKPENKEIFLNVQVRNDGEPKAQKLSTWAKKAENDEIFQWCTTQNF